MLLTLPMQALASPQQRNCRGQEKFHTGKFFNLTAESSYLSCSSLYQRVYSIRDCHSNLFGVVLSLSWRYIFHWKFPYMWRGINHPNSTDIHYISVSWKLLTILTSLVKEMPSQEKFGRAGSTLELFLFFLTKQFQTAVLIYILSLMSIAII